MSASLIASLSRLFGQQERSDCTLVFYCNATTADKDLKEASAQEQQQDSAAAKTPNDAEQPAAGPECEPAADQDQKETSQETASDWPDGPDEQQPGAAVEAASDISGAATTRSNKRGGSEATQTPAKRRKAAQTQTASQPELLPDDSMAVGDPLLAHMLVISGGSERFRAQLDRWVEEQGYGAKPVLRVPLDNPDDLPHALSAVKFMYTGKLDASDAATLLRVRRQAAYLQVEGCTEACDEALLALITAPQPSQQQQAGGLLAGVSQLYCCRDLLSRADVAPATLRKLLDVCRQQLVKHAGSADSGQQQQQGAGAAPAVVPSSTGGPGPIGELLAWAFGDAPSLMSREDVRRQLEALPAAAMEALLGCDSFATDSESTVLLMLLTWLQVNPSCNAKSRQRLLKLIRLTQLCDTYLFRLLPLTTLSIISPQELRFLYEYASAPEDKRVRMRQTAGPAGFDFSSAWYRDVPRPAPTAGEGSGSGDSRSYEWSVDAEKLRAALQSTESQKTAYVYGEFTSSGPRVVSNGLEWYPGVIFNKGKDAAGIYLFCDTPSVLRLNLTPEEPVLASPGSYRLVVYKWDGGSGGGGQREVGWSWDFTCSATFCRVGCGWGTPDALPFKRTLPSATAAASISAGDTQQQLLACWAPYLKDGKLWGCLSLGKVGE
ncbi:hypothetical protein PLESTB_001800700 [Pleodorina starrii]|uniref:BACK domain-containing protein n=1 Tax=Pleodorina starrii TaxID=330485 RepID=A0A9W6C026_9CHLO|nr:hypothetical protein PLESTM_001929000 [Pleodorina starrii]GLC61766.1 hypothetical protein PLESTB_001800700 [Pleodorina starrii]GLC67925.1 hypothetical protein PLESTF_000623600 [Pleodorina starrii]